MEHVIAAPIDGTVSKVFFEAGSLVNDGVALLEVEPKA
jgi:biotin carboxyl carrier protein